MKHAFSDRITNEAHFVLTELNFVAPTADYRKFTRNANQAYY